jgi:MYXO-CTERM domain-containing protein
MAGTTSSAQSPRDESSCAFARSPSNGAAALAALLALVALRRRRS